MNQILCCDWLPEQPKWGCLAHSGLPAVSWKKNFLKSHIMNPLLTKLVRSRWLDIGLVLFFCEFMYLDFTSVHKHAKKELGQYPAILTKQTWSITHTYSSQKLVIVINIEMTSEANLSHSLLFLGCEHSKDQFYKL